MGKIIQVAEYAKRHGKAKVSVTQKCQRGGFQTAYKSGNTWLIDEDEPYIDGRIKGGEYVGWRDKLHKTAAATEPAETNE